MKKLGLALGVLLIVQPALAFSPPRLDVGESIVLRVGAADCEGPIATASRPLRAPKNDPDRLLRMKQAGKLPDQFVCGKCTYSLAGDPSTAYYVKTCK